MTFFKADIAPRDHIAGPSIHTKYKILAISDVHMSNSLPHAVPGKRGITNRLRDQTRLWKAVAKDVERFHVDCVLILGDLFDKSRPSPTTLVEMVRIIVGLPCQVAILAGNHDAEQITGGRFNVEAFGAMDKPNVRYLRPNAMFSPRSWLHFYPVPFCPSAEAMEQIGRARQTMEARHGNPVDQNILLLHHSIVGCEHLGWTCDDGLDAEAVCEGFDSVLAGHFHQTQRFGPDLEGLYLGAPMHHNYGDVEREASYYVFGFRKGAEPREAKRDPGAPKFHKISVIKGAWPEWEPEERPRAGDYLRVEVHATHAEWIALRPQVREECAKLLTRDRIHASYKHKPIYQHAVRLEGDSKKTKKTTEDYLRTYVKRAATGDLDSKALLALGKNILGEARVS